MLHFPPENPPDGATMASTSNGNCAPEYIYGGFEIDEVPPEEFAAQIQEEVKLIGGCVTASVWEGSPNTGIARVIVGFPDRKGLEAYIRRYYSEGDLDPETIEQEVALIREI